MVLKWLHQNGCWKLLGLTRNYVLNVNELLLGIGKLQQSIMIGCAHLSYYTCHRREENNISSGTSSNLFLHTSLQACCIPSQGSKHWGKYWFIRNNRGKIAARASAPLILNALDFHVTGLRKVHFLRTHIGHAEVPHRDNGWDCKKQEAGSNCCHTTFSAPLSLCLLVISSIPV